MRKGLFTRIFSNPHITVLTSLFLLRKQRLREGSQLSRVTPLVSNRTRILTQIDATPNLALSHGRSVATAKVVGTVGSLGLDGL